LFLGDPITSSPRFQFDAGATIQLPIQILPAMIGTARHYQVVFSDPGAEGQYGITNALRVDFSQ